VCPGDIISEWKERDIEDARGNGSIGRQGTGEDIARVIAFLTDEKSDLITGSIIPVTGGLDVLGKVLKN
ncbi:SDR family oxidoreductase, partial [Neobacillus drentensis]